MTSLPTPGQAKIDSVTVAKAISVPNSIANTVIIGIRNALQFSYQIGLIKKKSYTYVKNHLNKIPLKKNFKNLFKIKEVNKIISFMKSDKKNISKKINVILIKDFGKIKLNFHINYFILKKFLLNSLN